MTGASPSPRASHDIERRINQERGEGRGEGPAASRRVVQAEPPPHPCPLPASGERGPPAAARVPHPEPSQLENAATNSLTWPRIVKYNSTRPPPAMNGGAMKKTAICGVTRLTSAIAKLT